MNTNVLFYIKKYKELINLEYYDRIREEMISDLKDILLNESNNIDTNYMIIETFYDINNDNVIDRLDELEKVLEETEISISNIKLSFNSKYEKIVQRDKKWLKSNKKKLLEIDYEDTELEVLNDYRVTFEQLLNRHSNFEKAFTTEEVNLAKFKDKRDDLKNGLDNYFRSGASYREVGLKKVKGEEAQFAVESMITYCELFLEDKKMIEEKINNVIIAISDSSVKESLSPIETLKLLLEADDPLKDIEKSSKELEKMEKTGTKENNNSSKEEPEKVDVTKDEKPEKTEKADVTKNEKQTKEKPEKVDVTKDEKQPEEEPVENEDNNEEVPEEEPETTETEEKPNDNLNNRQIGIAVLLSVIEARYFDYIALLKGLLEE